MSAKIEVNLVICEYRKECAEDCTHSIPHSRDWSCTASCPSCEGGSLLCKCIPYIIDGWDAKEN